MHKKKGKWQASYKDTWCLDTALSPIIAAALRKFIEVERHGIPSTVYNEELEDGGASLWEGYLTDMLWAFENIEEPDVPDGMFVHKDLGNLEFTIEVSDEEAYEAFKKEEAEFHAKRQYGFDLFAKYYTNLWD